VKKIVFETMQEIFLVQLMKNRVKAKGLGADSHEKSMFDEPSGITGKKNSPIPNGRGCSFR